MSEECSRDVGPWPEHLFMYEEEVDFSLRATSHGWLTWYEPQAGAVRMVEDTELAPWRQGLMRRNRVRRTAQVSRVRALGVATGLVVGDLLRAVAGRPEARAGLWSVLHRATPEEVMARYAPGSTPSVASVGVQSSATVVRSALQELP
jgi:hypothetical protein